MVSGAGTPVGMSQATPQAPLAVVSVSRCAMSALPRKLPPCSTPKNTICFFVVQKPFNTYVVVPECFQPAYEIESLRISRKLLKAVQHELYLDARVAVPFVGGGDDVVDLGDK